MLITVDGTAYDLRVRAGELTRGARIEDGLNAGKLKSGAWATDTIGTFYEYQVTFLRNGTSAAAIADYDALYEVLTDPALRQHIIVLPYGQSTLTYTALISEVTDTLKKQRGGVNYWDEMTVVFAAQRPQRTPY